MFAAHDETGNKMFQQHANLQQAAGGVLVPFLQALSRAPH
jgi:hypothetical protein